MTIKIVSEIPASRKQSKYDSVLDEVIRALDKHPEKVVEVSDEGPGLVSRFKGLKKDGKMGEINCVRRNGTAYFNTVI